MSDTAPNTATTALYQDLTHRTQAQVMADEANMDMVFAAIRAERCRQIEVGHTPAADDRLARAELIDSAVAYIDVADQMLRGRDPAMIMADFRETWRLGAGALPADTTIANLTRACALLVAEIERQRRAKMRAAAQQEA